MIQKLSLVLLFFFVSACTQMPAMSSGQVTSTVTSTSADLPTAAPAVIETGTVPAAVGVAVSQNVPLTVYAKGGTIWLAGGGNPPKQLTVSRVDPATQIEEHDSSPKISDDGRVIAFLRDGDLWAMDRDGEHARMLASTRDLKSDMVALQLDFAPRSHDIYLNIQMSNASTPEYHLVKVDPNVPGFQLILGAGQGAPHVIFSPDGKKIALPRTDKINVVNADGSDLKTVFSFQAVSMDGGLAYIPEIVWLPDGSGFKTVIPSPAAQTRFMFISANGAIVAQLAAFDASLAFANRPFISPDGSKVVYTKAHGADLELHIIDASTADEMYFSHTAQTFGILGWTPDSARIVYWADARNQLWLGPQADKAVRLGDVPDVKDVRWVDAQHYLFVAHASELRFAALGQPSILVDEGLSESAFEFTTLH